MGNLPFGYACVALDEETGGRCPGIANIRELSGRKTPLFCNKHEEVCRQTGKMPEMTFEPDVVLAQFFMGQRTAERAAELFPEKQRDFAASRARNLKRAKELGAKVHHKRGLGDFTGTRVFGENGLKAVSLTGLSSELESEGLALLGAHIFEHRKGKKVLSCAFVYEGEGKEPERSEERAFVFSLFAESWAYAHVWANLPKEDGTVLHAVNLLAMGGEPKFLLKFAGGLWHISKFTGGDT